MVGAGDPGGVRLPWGKTDGAQKHSTARIATRSGKHKYFMGLEFLFGVGCME